MLGTDVDVAGVAKVARQTSQGRAELCDGFLCSGMSWQAQFPNSRGAQDDGYSHCPAPGSDSVREKMLELAPPSLMPLSKSPEVQNVSMWGSTADMVRTSYELLGMGALKYTSKGSREFTSGEEVPVIA